MKVDSRENSSNYSEGIFQQAMTQGNFYAQVGLFCCFLLVYVWNVFLEYIGTQYAGIVWDILVLAFVGIFVWGFDNLGKPYQSHCDLTTISNWELNKWFSMNWRSKKRGPEPTVYTCWLDLYVYDESSLWQQWMNMRWPTKLGVFFCVRFIY